MDRLLQQIDTNETIWYSALNTEYPADSNDKYEQSTSKPPPALGEYLEPVD
jgi:hypothetical protein